MFIGAERWRSDCRRGLLQSEERLAGCAGVGSKGQLHCGLLRSWLSSEEQVAAIHGARSRNSLSFEMLLATLRLPHLGTTLEVTTLCLPKVTTNRLLKVVTGLLKVATLCLPKVATL